MRCFSAVVLAGFVGVAGPACADTITENVAFSFNSGDGLMTVSGPLFNPVLGTLTSVSAVVSGSYAPDIVIAPQSSPQTSALLFYAWGVTGEQQTQSLQSYSVTQTGNTLTGPVQAFSFATGAFPFPQNYIDVGGYPAYASGFLLNLDIYSEPTIAGAWGDFDDESLLSGTVQITYSYTVPEPSSLAILAFGASLLGLGVSRRRPVLASADQGSRHF
jgi:hypothetical protein